MHGGMESRGDADIRRFHNEAGMVVPDGMPLVWMNHYYGRRHVTRCYGPDLFLAVMKDSVGKDAGFKHFFYGGAEGVPELLGERMQERFPGLNVVGAYSPPFRELSPEEDEHIIQMIRNSEADIVWVGLSTPKQERWMSEHVNKLSRPVLVGVGAAFDFHTGRVVQAPKFIQKSGLEWLFRMLMEPKRLWKRYSKNVPLFLLLILRQMASGRRPPHPRG
ncbi:putative N-acetylmannosaminyltransferase [bacterium BMS3Bbin04]|nr:putative N-acetylmannosaminyltransferase [bacterium BMS3Bbin04]